MFNPNLASAEQAAHLYGGTASSDLDAVLGDPSVDAVVIATPTNTHVESVEATAKVGKPIYCEKPLDQRLERVDLHWRA